MSIGFGSIGETSIGESPSIGPATIDLPAPPIISLSAMALAIFAGAAIILPAPPAVAVSTAPAQIQGGANIALPAPERITLTTPIPAVSGGASPQLPAPSRIGLAASPLGIFGGGMIDTPTPPRISLSSPVLQILQSANIWFPAPPRIALQSPPLFIGGGANIIFDTEIQIITNGGGISEGAIGEFSIGEGEASIISFRGPPRISLESHAVEIQGGAIIDVPYATIRLSSPILEIESRSRRLRVLVIAS